MWFPNPLLEKQYQDGIVGCILYFHLGQYKVCGITFVYKGYGSKFVYLQILTILWKYTDLLPHPLYKLPCKPNYKQLRINALLKVTQDNRKFLEVLDKFFDEEKDFKKSLPSSSHNKLNNKIPKSIIKASGMRRKHPLHFLQDFCSKLVEISFSDYT